MAVALFIFLAGFSQAQSSSPQGDQKMAPGLSKQIEAQFAKEWTSIHPQSNRKRLSWSFQQSPPIPTSWPVVLNAPIVVYAYATARDPQLRDGEVISTVWGKVEYKLTNPDQLTFSNLTPKPGELGIQGVTPMKDEDAKLFPAGWREHMYLKMTMLAAQAEFPRHLDTTTLKRYQLWFKDNAVIGDEIQKDPAIKPFCEQIQSQSRK